MQRSHTLTTGAAPLRRGSVLYRFCFLIVFEAVAETLPVPSLYWTYTVLVPFPLDRSHPEYVPGPS